MGIVKSWNTHIWGCEEAGISLFVDAPLAADAPLLVSKLVSNKCFHL